MFKAKNFGTDLMTVGINAVINAGLDKAKIDGKTKMLVQGAVYLFADSVPMGGISKDYLRINALEGIVRSIMSENDTLKDYAKHVQGDYQVVETETDYLDTVQNEKESFIENETYSNY